jgi:hypothetical protein
MAQRAEGFIQVLPQSTGEKVWVEQISDGISTLDIQHVTVGVDLVLQDNATLTATGSQVIYIGGNSEVDVTLNIKATPSGTSPTIQISIQDVDPGDLTTGISTSVSGASHNAIGIENISYCTNSGYVKVTWTIGGSASPTFTQTYISVSAKAAAVAKGAQRTFVILSYDRIAGITTEALATMTINRGGTTSSAASYTVTPGKTLRLQSLHAEILNTTTTANRTITRIRAVNGTVSATSPVVMQAAAQSPLATSTSGESDDTTVPDGLDIPGGWQVGISHLENATTAGIASASLVANEY